MANTKKGTPAISEEYKLQMQFFIKDKTGKIVKVSRSKFQKEAEKYINLGYGGYYDISQKEANKRAKAHILAEKKAAQKEAMDIKAAQKSVEEKDAALLKLDDEVTTLDVALTEAKALVDDQQKANATLVVEKDKLATEAEKANKEKTKLAEEVKKMKEEIIALKKK